MRDNRRKGAITMTNVLNNVENIIENYEEHYNNEKTSRLEIILLYMKVKKIIKSDFAQNLIKEYIEKVSGKYTIKGTRITGDDIGYVMSIKKDMTIQDVLNEYPSLDNEKQALAGLMVYIDKHMSLLKLLF